MTYAFDEPDEVGGEYLKPSDLLGHLLLVWAVHYIDHSPTRFTEAGKMSDVIVVDCVDLDNKEQPSGKLVRKCWWRNAKLIGALRSKLGKESPMLAVMTLGVATKGNPPYELMSATSDRESVARANVWLSANPDFVPSTYGTVPAPASRPVAAAAAPARPATSETMLERMARISQENKLPPRPPVDAEQARATSNGEGDIPF